MKVIAFYLPQFHSIPENDKWWGEGFTEWTNMKKATPLFEGHNQPRIPLNNNYYNLLEEDIKQWQVDLAKKHGVYGFCYYHYWFSGKLLLEKPLEQMLANKEINMPFCLSWANESWTKAWERDGGHKEVIMPQHYGEKQEWVEHFLYLLKFFKDERYIKINNKPLLIIYKPELINCCNEMLDCWKELAVEHGLDGIEFSYQHINFENLKNKDDSRFSFGIEYEPAYSFYDYNINISKLGRATRRAKNSSLKVLSRYFKFNFNKSLVAWYDYDNLWNYILKRKPSSDKKIPGAFVDWDNTPRRGDRGFVVTGASPEKFKKYLSQQIIRAKKIYKKDMLFIFAWNEWAEGGYLEPDEKNKHAYLEAMRDALIENNEFEK